MSATPRTKQKAEAAGTPPTKKKAGEAAGTPAVKKAAEPVGSPPTTRGKAKRNASKGGHAGYVSHLACSSAGQRHLLYCSCYLQARVSGSCTVTVLLDYFLYLAWLPGYQLY